MEARSGGGELDRADVVARLAPFGIDEADVRTRERRMAQQAGRSITLDEVFWSIATEHAIRFAAAGRWHDASELYLVMARRRHERDGDVRPLRLEAERFRVRHILTSNGDRSVELEISACDCEVCWPSHGRRVPAGDALAGDIDLPHDGCDWCTCTVQAAVDPDAVRRSASFRLSTLLAARIERRLGG